MADAEAGSGAEDRASLSAAEVGVRELSGVGADVVVGDDYGVVPLLLAHPDLVGEEACLMLVVRVAHRPALEDDDLLLSRRERPEHRRIRDLGRVIRAAVAAEDGRAVDLLVGEGAHRLREAELTAGELLSRQRAAGDGDRQPGRALIFVGT